MSYQVIRQELSWIENTVSESVVASRDTLRGALIYASTMNYISAEPGTTVVCPVWYVREAA